MPISQYADQSISRKEEKKEEMSLERHTHTHFRMLNLKKSVRKGLNQCEIVEIDFFLCMVKNQFSRCSLYFEHFSAKTRSKIKKKDIF